MITRGMRKICNDEYVHHNDFGDGFIYILTLCIKTYKTVYFIHVFVVCQLFLNYVEERKGREGGNRVGVRDGG